MKPSVDNDFLGYKSCKSYDELISFHMTYTWWWKDGFDKLILHDILLNHKSAGWKKEVSGSDITKHMCDEVCTTFKLFSKRSRRLVLFGVR